jgi:dTDP-4-dehydrorhamnose 3,5-epimerase
MRFDVIDTSIEGLKVVQRKPINDDRGYLSRLYCDDDFKLMGVHKPISQINHTLTNKMGAIRGMHYQLPPFAEVKLVSCIRGEIFDVAIDLRKNSPTYLKWHAEILSEKNQKSFLISEGFAHGFQTLTAKCELIYLHTAPYSKEHERGLNYADKSINIDWPLEIVEISDRDQTHPLIQSDFEGIIL